MSHSFSRNQVSNRTYAAIENLDTGQSSEKRSSTVARGKRLKRSGMHGSLYSRVRLNRSAFPITLTDDKAMAAAAMMGDSNTPNIKNACGHGNAYRVIEEGEEQVLPVPSFCATARAVVLLSPVSMTTRIPAAFSAEMAERVRN